MNSGRISEELEKKVVLLLKNSVFLAHYNKLFKACFTNLLGDEPNFTVLRQIEEQVGEEAQSLLIEAFNISMLLVTDFVRKNFVEAEIKFSLGEIGFDN